MAIDPQAIDRMARMGAAALSNSELLSILGAQVKEARIRDLAGETLQGLQSRARLTRLRAARVLAAIELGTRVTAPDGGLSFRTPADSARYLLPRYSAIAVETFGIICLNIRHRMIGEQVISTGCLSSSLVHPREVFKVAIAARSAAILLFHNHPSGDPEPSAEDVSLTRRLASAGTLMGIDVIDHLVIGAGRYVSFKDRGQL